MQRVNDSQRNDNLLLRNRKTVAGGITCERSRYHFETDHILTITKLSQTNNEYNNPISRQSYLGSSLEELTITGDECAVVSAVLVEFVAFGGCFASRSLHEEVVFVKGAFPTGRIQ